MYHLVIAWVKDRINKVQVWWATLRGKPRHYRMHAPVTKFASTFKSGRKVDDV